MKKGTFFFSHKRMIQVYIYISPERWGLGCPPLPVRVTTRIIVSLVGDPYKPSFPLLLGEFSSQKMVLYLGAKVSAIHPPTHHDRGLWCHCREILRPARRDCLELGFFDTARWCFSTPTWHGTGRNLMFSKTAKGGEFEVFLLP